MRRQWKEWLAVRRSGEEGTRRAASCAAHDGSSPPLGPLLLSPHSAAAHSPLPHCSAAPLLSPLPSPSPSDVVAAVALFLGSGDERPRLESSSPADVCATAPLSSSLCDDGDGQARHPHLPPLPSVGQATLRELGRFLSAPLDLHLALTRLPSSFPLPRRAATRTWPSSTAGSTALSRTSVRRRHCSGPSLPLPSPSHLFPCCSLPPQFVNREERENAERWLREMARVDPCSEEAERELLRILEAFHVVPQTELKKALSEWKIRGWLDLIEWKTRP